MEQSRCFNECQYNTQCSIKLLKIVSLGFLFFSVMGDQKWEKTQKWHFVGFEQNFQSPHQLTLERAEGVAIDPISL